MSQLFKPCDRAQRYLLPPSMRDWLPGGDPAYFIIDVVEELDLHAIYAYYERDSRIAPTKAALEAAAKEKARADGKLDENDKPILPKHGRPPAMPPGEPKPTDQRNFTDPESRIMKMPTKAFDQAYNCQAAADAESQIIVAEDVTDTPNDKEQVVPMVKEIEANTGEKPEQLSADSGYDSEANVTALREQGIDDAKCIRCGTCRSVCPAKAVVVE